MTHSPKCEVCGEKLGRLEDTDFDHRVPLALGGTNELSNFRGLHKVPCHREKTAADVTSIAKAKRIEAKRKGLKKPKGTIPSRPFQKRVKSK